MSMAGWNSVSDQGHVGAISPSSVFPGHCRLYPSVVSHNIQRESLDHTGSQIKDGGPTQTSFPYGLDDTQNAKLKSMTPLLFPGSTPFKVNTLTYDNDLLSYFDNQNFSDDQQIYSQQFLPNVQCDLSSSETSEAQLGHVQTMNPDPGAGPSKAPVYDFAIQEKSSSDPLPDSIPKPTRQNKYRVDKAKRCTRQVPKAVRSSNMTPSGSMRPGIQAGSGQQSPDHLITIACHIWLLRNPATMPSEHIISCINFLYGDSLENIRNWFSRNVGSPIAADDAVTRTVTARRRDIAAGYRFNRKECNRKAGNVGLDDTRLIQFNRDAARPFACTSRCGAAFSKKQAWKRHEEINRPPRVWICNNEACHEAREGKGVFFRKDHFRNHLTNDHGNNDIKKREIAACCMPIKSNFSRHCIFRNCEIRFDDWKDRTDHVAEHLKDTWAMSEWRDPDDDIEHSGSTTSDASDSDSSECDTDSESDFDMSDGGRAAPHNDGTGRDARPRNRGSKPSRPGKSQGSNFSHNHSANSGGSSRSSESHTSRPSTASLTDCRNSHPSLKSSKSPCNLSFSGKLCLRTHRQTSPHRCLEKQQRQRPKSIVYTTVSDQSVNGQQIVARKRTYDEMNEEVHHHRRALLITMFLQPVAVCNIWQLLNACTSGDLSGGELASCFSCLLSGIQYTQRAALQYRAVEPKNQPAKHPTGILRDFGLPKSAGDFEGVSADKEFFDMKHTFPDTIVSNPGRADDILALGNLLIELNSTARHKSLKDTSLLQWERRYRVAPYHISDTNWIAEWIYRMTLCESQRSLTACLFFILDECRAAGRLQEDLEVQLSPLFTPDTSDDAGIEVSGDIEMEDGDEPPTSESCESLYSLETSPESTLPSLDNMCEYGDQSIKDATKNSPYYATVLDVVLAVE